MGIAINQNLKSLMQRQKISASDLARKSSVAKQTISDWLAGAKPTNIRGLVRIASILGVTLDELILGPVPNSDNDVSIVDGRVILDFSNLIKSCPAQEVVCSGRCPLESKIESNISLRIPRKKSPTINKRCDHYER